MLCQPSGPCCHSVLFVCVQGCSRCCRPSTNVSCWQALLRGECCHALLTYRYGQWLTLTTLLWSVWWLWSGSRGRKTLLTRSGSRHYILTKPVRPVSVASHSLVVAMLWFWEDFALVTHVLLILLTGDSQPLCDECKSSLTVKCILLEWCNLKNDHEKYFTCSSSKALFGNHRFYQRHQFYHLV